MKKILHILIFTLLITAVFCISASAASWTDADGRTWNFTVTESNKTATITGAELKTGEVRTSELNIPAKVYVDEVEYTVTTIGKEAFKCGTSFKSGSSDGQNSALNKKYFGHVTIPTTVIEIGEKAFAYSAIYGEVVIPDSVAKIGNYAFLGCVGLDTVVYSSAMDSIPTGCFQDCKALVEFKTEGVIKNYGGSAFNNCQSLLNITISPETETIGGSAFSSCYCISGVLDLTNLKSLGDSAFASCYFLEGVKLGTYNFNTNAFSSCSHLKYFDVSDESTNYCDVDGVLYSKDLTILYRYPLGKYSAEYIIPETVKTVKGSAFEGASSLTRIEIIGHPDGIAIDGSAFKATGISTMYFPDNVTSVGDNVLDNCSNLTWIVFGKNVSKFYSGMTDSCPKLEYIFTTRTGTGSEALSGSYPGGEKFITYISGRDCVTYYGSHRYGYLDTDATCEQGGTNICCFCNQSVDTTPVGHVGQVLRSTSLTCTTPESIIIDCINCDTEATVILKANSGHTLSSVEAKTEDKYSYSYQKCSTCGEIILGGFETKAYTNGDVNGDGVIDSKDASLLAKIVAGADSSANRFACDINADGSVTTLDLLLLKQYIAQLGTTISDNQNECAKHLHINTVAVSYEDCTYGGLYVSYCADCGAVLEKKDADVKGHFFVETILTSSTCSTEGRSSRTCSVCSLSEEITVEKLPHEHSWWMLSDDEVDYEYSWCKVCGIFEHRAVDRAVLQEIVSTIPQNYAVYCTAESAALLKPIVDNAEKALTQAQVDEIVEEIRRVLPTLEYNVTDVPVIYLESPTNLSKAEYSRANIIVAYYDENGTLKTLTDSEGQMRIRGNYTSSCTAKLPFNIKFSRKVDLLGMGEGKKYNLLANAYDATTIRNALAFEFAEDLGLDYTSKYRIVEVYHNGVYKGCYTLTTPIDIGEDRVDIDEEKDVLIHLSERNGSEDTAFPSPIFNINLMRLEEPEEYSPYTRSQMMRIMYQLDFAILSGDTDEMEKYMDVDSMVRYFIFHEYVKDMDIIWDSTRFYIEDGKLHGGPVWDLDISQGNVSKTQGGTNLSAGHYYWYRDNFKYNYTNSGVEYSDIYTSDGKYVNDYVSALGTWASVYWAYDYGNKSTTHVRWWFYFLAEYSDEFMTKVAEFIRDNKELFESYYQNTTDPDTDALIKCKIDYLSQDVAGEAIYRNFVDGPFGVSANSIYKSSTIPEANDYLRTWWKTRCEWLYDYYTTTYLADTPAQ